MHSDALRCTAYTTILKPINLDDVINMLDQITNQQASNRLKKNIQDKE